MEVGVGGAGYREVGTSAVKSDVRAVPRLALAGAGLVALAGCSSTGSIAGAVTGAAAGGGSANPALGYAVGIGTKAAVDSLSRYISRKRHQAEQDQIAAVVGSLPVGQGAAWQIKHAIPVNNQHGYVTVVREIPNALTLCKEVVFTVNAGKRPDGPRGYYTTTACQQGVRWKWAQAEPATRRWGNLQ